MADLDPRSPEYQAREIRKFARVLALAAAGLAALPVLIGFLARPQGHTYLPFHLSLDDHMVYAAWMRQAMEGRLLFDDRFTTDPQPGLTFHALFLLLGFVAKALGVPLTLTLSRIGFSYLAVRLLGEFMVRLQLPSFTGKFAVVMSVFGGGVAFLHWQDFGDSYAGAASWFTSLLQGHQPIDNWQPEAFFFPAMLTNGLFMAACCLILWTLNCVLDSRSSWKPVLPGAVAFGLLMNVHSYDVVLVALVLVAFVVTLLASGQFDAKWALRSLIIGLGAVPAALWLMHVLASDPVFKSRAQTLTYTGGFMPILIGLLPLVLLSFLALWRADLPKARRTASVAALLLFVVAMSVFVSSTEGGYQMSSAGWVLAAIAAMGVAALASKKDLGWNLLWSWAMVSLVAPYFPALFQRKLSMLMVVPWAIIAAIGLARELKAMERQPRNLVAALALAVVCLTSVFWLRRDVELVRAGVSKTVVHNLYLTHDESEVVERLQHVEPGAGVLAMPGIAGPELGAPAYLSDLAPVFSGLAGVHTFAGHWSETPDFNRRRAAATQFYLRPLSVQNRLALLRQWRVQYVVVPKQEAYSEIQFADLSGLGETVYDGQQLALVKVPAE